MSPSFWSCINLFSPNPLGDFFIANIFSLSVTFENSQSDCLPECNKSILCQKSHSDSKDEDL